MSGPWCWEYKLTDFKSAQSIKNMREAKWIVTKCVCLQVFVPCLYGICSSSYYMLGIFPPVLKISL